MSPPSLSLLLYGWHLTTDVFAPSFQSFSFLTELDTLVLQQLRPSIGGVPLRLAVILYDFLSPSAFHWQPIDDA